jgi:hypothetical protein
MTGSSPSVFRKLKDPSKYDDVKVRVEEGDVTITASGTGVYYIGEEITLSGTCTDNKNNVYLFLTGPNLPAAGVNLTRLDKAVSDQMRILSPRKKLRLTTPGLTSGTLQTSQTML